MVRDSSWSDPCMMRASDVLGLTPGTGHTQTNLDNAFRSVKGDTWGSKLHSTSNCMCCATHQVDRPSNLAPWHELPSREKMWKRGSCACNCRHVARQICRQFEYFIQRDEEGHYESVRTSSKCPVGPPIT